MSSLSLSLSPSFVHTVGSLLATANIITMYSLAPTLSLLPLLAGPALAILDGIDARDVYEEMEHIYVDNFGTNSDGFIGAVTPCKNYFQDTKGIEGEQSSAQWVRIVFHDFVTANLTEGTGYGLTRSLVKGLPLTIRSVVLTALSPTKQTVLRTPVSL
jgi:hypothetical protein